MKIRESLEQIVGKYNVKEQVELKQYTTFRIGGPARYFVMPKTTEDIPKLIATCKKEAVPYFVLGKGSNVLVSDTGFDGVVIRLCEHLCTYEISPDGHVHAMAGANLMQVARECTLKGLKGFSFASGIPGSIGGAVAMNAGAYGGEIAQVISGAWLYDPATDKTAYYTQKELELGYRNSIVLQKDLVVLSADFVLPTATKQEKEEEIRQMEENNRLRMEKQPLQYPSAGSTFKRPAGAYAGKLIQDAGLAGFCIGDACVSEKHCGFVINKKNASATEVITLCREVARRVKEMSGYELELEVRLVGHFLEEK